MASVTGASFPPVIFLSSLSLYGDQCPIDQRSARRKRRDWLTDNFISCPTAFGSWERTSTVHCPPSLDDLAGCTVTTRHPFRTCDGQRMARQDCAYLPLSFPEAHSRICRQCAYGIYDGNIDIHASMRLPLKRISPKVCFNFPYTSLLLNGLWI